MDWNDRHCEYAMKSLKRRTEALNLDLDKPFLNQLKSKKLTKDELIKYAYVLGQARGIQLVNEGATPIRIDPLETIINVPSVFNEQPEMWTDFKTNTDEIHYIDDEKL